MTAAGSWTSVVRAELAALPPGPVDERRAEAVAFVRLGGALRLRGGGAGVDVVVTLADGASTRRLRGHLLALYGSAPEVEVHRPTNLRGTAWRLVVVGGQHVLRHLRVLDGSGRPYEGIAGDVVEGAGRRAAFLRGAVLAAATASDPRRAPHLEIRAPSERTAADVAAIVEAATGGRAAVGAHAERWRVVLKSADAIGALLAVTGAHAAFLRWEDARLRGALRGAANRAANGDRANVARTLRSAGRQVADVQRLVDAVGFEGLPDELAPVALARLANPEASLAELGGLVDPPLAKATVHRRLARLAALAAAAGPPA